ncbi:curli assembly protein CsgF [Limnohabitans sp.]|uniref:curli assembly protein CsgF n=1 Tax=Limnohabitans sp. TaxID=1907725 RepID=UPI0038B80188
MKQSIFAGWLSVALCAVLAAPVHGGELRYAPVNPLFGGNPLNASGLLAIANANNDFTAPKTPDPTPLEKFTNAIESAIASKLQSQVITSLFDAKGNFSPSGTETAVGNFVISIKPGSDGNLSIVTKDKTTGQSTEISIGNILNQ